ncbi:MAG: Lrp/AsnC family transcriptional regulator [Desulfobacteraceae bacterium]|nr:Lrp/AsnC family transcriptional regulator [Desulfobacteraceae bacterium]
MDGIDIKILNALYSNARTKNSALARELNMPATTLQERIRRLEEKGIIKGYKVVADLEKLGLNIQAFLAVTLDNHESSNIRRFEKSIKDISCIKACYHVSGRFDYLLHTQVQDLQKLGDLVKTGISSLPDFGRCETFIVFSEIDSNHELPLMDI